MSGSERGDAIETALLAEYAEVNANFRLLTDIRFKLLALLPLAAAAAVGLGLIHDGGTDRATMAAACALFAFGLLATLALASYNERNDQLYLWLVTRGAEIERQLGLLDGSFAHRPNAWFDVKLGPGRWHVGHASSVKTLYAGVAMLWMVGASVTAAQLVAGERPVPAAIDAAVVLASILGGLGCIGWVRRQKAERVRQMWRLGEIATENAGELVSKGGLETCRGSEAFEAFVTACVGLIGRDHRPDDRREEVLSRIDFYDQMDEDERVRHGLGSLAGPGATANYVALIVDLPPYAFTRTPRRR